LEKSHSRDEDVHLSVAFILCGSEREIKKLRGEILDFIGAHLDNFGVVHQNPAREGLRLIYHTISRQPLYVVKEIEWRKMREGGRETNE